MAAPLQCQKDVPLIATRFEAALALTHVAERCPVVPQELAVFPEEPPHGGCPQERGDCLDLACFRPESDGYPGPTAVGHGTQEYCRAARFRSAR